MVRKVFECYVCHKNFKSKKSNLLRHLKLHGPIVECYKCPRCRQSFQNRQNFHRHWIDKHSNIAVQPENPILTYRITNGTVMFEFFFNTFYVTEYIIISVGFRHVPVIQPSDPVYSQKEIFGEQFTNKYKFQSFNQIALTNNSGNSSSQTEFRYSHKSYRRKSIFEPSRPLKEHVTILLDFTKFENFGTLEWN